jgi:hypothetical protein
MLLTADWHLDDKPENEYRWVVFDQLLDVSEKTSDRHVVILGDLCDRKDKHSAQLVNRLMQEFEQLLLAGLRIDILMGNHDAPVSGVPFWECLNYIADRLRFYTKPNIQGGIAYLPFTPDPTEAWKGIDWSALKLAFIHQPIKGADAGGHILEDGSPMPIFPRTLRVYAGDIHYPQKIGRIEYVGAPHRVRFGDNHRCRFVRVNALDPGQANEVTLYGPLKAVAAVSSFDDLHDYQLTQGDMVRVRMTIPADRIEGWPAEQERIKAWAAKEGIVLAGIEGIVDNIQQAVSIPRFDSDPRLVLQEFCKQEGLDQGLIDAGIRYL